MARPCLPLPPHSEVINETVRNGGVFAISMRGTYLETYSLERFLGLLGKYYERILKRSVLLTSDCFRA